MTPVILTFQGHHWGMPRDKLRITQTASHTPAENSDVQHMRGETDVLVTSSTITLNGTKFVMMRQLKTRETASRRQTGPYFYPQMGT